MPTHLMASLPVIHWALQSSTRPDWRAVEQAPERLLSVEELRVLAALRVPKRRRDWLLGRWTAKRLVRSFLRLEHGDAALEELSILAAADGAPVVRLLGAPGEHCGIDSLSISHSSGVALAALCTDGVPVGADIERVEPRSDGFAADYFTAEELRQVEEAPRAARDTIVTALWSAKEAVLKALRLGLTIDTRSVCCRLQSAESGWAPFTARVAAGPGCDGAAVSASSLWGWWQAAGPFVLTLATGLAPTQSPTPRQHDLDREVLH